MNPRLDLIEDLAPQAPPCFGSRRSWVMYLESADEARKPGRGLEGPIVIVNGEPAFNESLNFCTDCESRHASRMVLAGRCKPNALKQQASRAQSAPINESVAAA